MKTSLFLSLKTQALLLTPNQRLAATLMKHYTSEKIKQGERTFPTPHIRPLNIWIQDLWSQLVNREMNGDFLLLTPDQELVLWEEVISEEPESSELLKLSDLAKQAKSAWSTLKLWQLGFDHHSFVFTDNARHFQTWALRFEERLKKQSLLDGSSLITYLIEMIKAKRLQIPPNLILLNFTEIAPQYRALLQACEERGLTLTYENIHSGHSAYQICLADEETELHTMVRWAKRIHERDPEVSIGCIVADLEDKREMLLAALNTVFENPSSYNISAGRTLASYPIIQEALTLLRLPQDIWSSQEVCALLHSPFLGDAEREMLQRIQLDSHLRRHNRCSLTWSQFMSELENLACPLLSERLKAYFVKRKKQPTLQKISLWLSHFAELIEILGWPGEQSLNSSEYQVVKRWQELLLETSRLDLVLEKVSYSKALHYLKVLAVKTYFQPESPDAPVQILGQLEGAGIPFHFLWVQGLDDTAWPPPPAPNPLIPQALQRAFGMPNATAQRQLDYSKRLTQQYQEAAPLVFFSYAHRNAREELRPSPLIAHFESRSLSDLDLASEKNYQQIVFHSRNLEQFRDDQGPPVEKQEILRGGASLFEMQAACPFKAFAKLRLGAYAIEEPELGLPAKSRGSVLHKTLELLWKDLKTQQNLQALQNEQLHEKVQKALKAALSLVAPFIHPDTLYYNLLLERLQPLLLNCLNLEKSRPPFTIAALEEIREISFENFKLRLRVDRIDKLPGGEKLIIDYKIRKTCDTASWFGERPDEPQLPLYSLLQQDEIVGLAFAQLHPNQIKLTGLSRKDIALQGVTVLNEKTGADALTWERQLDEWRRNLTALFLAFQKGLATRDPKKGPETCRSCDLQALCRIHEDDSYAHDPLDS